MSVRKTKYGTWLVDFYYNNQVGIKCRYRKQHNFKSKKEAKQYEKEKMLAFERDAKKVIGENESGNHAKIISTNEVKLEDYLDWWLETYVETNNSPKEILRKIGIVNNQLKPLLGEKFVCKIKPSDGEFLKAKLQKRNYSPRSVNYALGTLKKSLKCAVADQIINYNPLQSISKVPTVETIDSWDWLKTEESEKFLAEVLKSYSKWYPYILVLLRTGIRVGELCGLFWEDINLEKKEIVIRRSLVNRNYGPTKSRKERKIPLTDSVVFTLRKHQQVTRMLLPVEVRILGKIHFGTHVFVDQDNRPHKYLSSSIRKPISGALRAVDLRRIRVHDLRHSFASQLRLKGIPLEDIQDLLGHSDIKTTLRYAHISPEQKRVAVDVLEMASSQ